MKRFVGNFALGYWHDRSRRPFHEHKHPPNKHGWRLALAAVLAALWLTACGGGDSVSATTALAPSPAPAQAAAQLPAVGETQTAAPALAVVPSTGEFRVNTTAAGSQSNPVIARLKDGSHVVVGNPNKPRPLQALQRACKAYAPDVMAPMAKR